MRGCIFSCLCLLRFSHNCERSGSINRDYKQLFVISLKLTLTLLRPCLWRTTVQVLTDRHALMPGQLQGDINN